MPKLATAVQMLGVDVVCASEDYRDVMEAYSQPFCYVVRCAAVAYLIDISLISCLFLLIRIVCIDRHTNQIPTIQI